MLTGDRLGASLAGPGIRAWNIARVLAAAAHPVRLVSTDTADIESALFEVGSASPREPAVMDANLDWADLIVVQGHALEQFESLRRTSKPMVCDLYDPMHLEQLEQARSLGPEQWRHRVLATTDVLNRQLRRGDFFLCASDRQRHFWLGQLAALGRINPDTYRDDPGLRRLLAVVPFGLDANPPVQTRHPIRGTVPGIGPDDRILLWGGGVYDWFDTATLLRAVARIAPDRPDLRLFFLGLRSPNQAEPISRAAAATIALADDLELTGRHVFLNDGWVAFDDRQNYLLDADAGVSTHFDHVETTFAFRTRMLDYLWASLPIVTTDGDSFADLVRERDLGAAVPAQDVGALAGALDRVLYGADTGRFRANVAATAVEFTWERTLAPLVEYCRDPRPAPDRPVDPTAIAAGPTLAGAPPTSVRRDIALLREYLRAGGVREVLARAGSRLGRMTHRRRSDG